jgi:pyruvate formate lyase activating enzyme
LRLKAEHSYHFGVEGFLRRRIGFIDGVVFSGGEPTIHAELPEFIAHVKHMGFEIALHTNGCFPDMIETLIAQKLVNYFAVDVKAPFQEYSLVSAIGSGEGVRESLSLIARSGVPFEVRTTYHPQLFCEAKLFHMVENLEKSGVRKFVLQKVKHGNILDPSLEFLDWLKMERRTIKAFERFFKDFEIRSDHTLQADSQSGYIVF